jgi:hypothetical protein
MTSTISQADRDAANEWIRGMSLGLKMMLSDPHKLYTAFAQHANQARLSGYQQGAAEERARAARLATLLSEAADEMRVAACLKNDLAKEWWHAGEKHAARFIATAIRNGENNC